jgi:hypothetical protein
MPLIYPDAFQDDQDITNVLDSLRIGTPPTAPPVAPSAPLIMPRHTRPIQRIVNVSDSGSNTNNRNTAGPDIGGDRHVAISVREILRPVFNRSSRSGRSSNNTTIPNIGRDRHVPASLREVVRPVIIQPSRSSRSSHNTATPNAEHDRHAMILARGVVHPAIDQPSRSNANPPGKNIFNILYHNDFNI